MTAIASGVVSVDPWARLLDVLSSLRDHRRRLPVLLAEKDAALAEWRELAELPKCRAGDAVQDQLRELGWSEEDVALVGVGDRAVRKSLERPRPYR